MRRAVKRFICRHGGHKMTGTALGAVRYQAIDSHVVEKWGTSPQCVRCGVSERFTVVLQSMTVVAPIEIAGSNVLVTGVQLVEKETDR